MVALKPFISTSNINTNVNANVSSEGWRLEKGMASISNSLSNLGVVIQADIDTEKRNDLSEAMAEYQVRLQKKNKEVDDSFSTGALTVEQYQQAMRESPVKLMEAINKQYNRFNSKDFSDGLMERAHSTVPSNFAHAMNNTEKVNEAKTESAISKTVDAMALTLSTGSMSTSQDQKVQELIAVGGYQTKVEWDGLYIATNRKAIEDARGSLLVGLSSLNLPPEVVEVQATKMLTNKVGTAIEVKKEEGKYQEALSLLEASQGMIEQSYYASQKAKITELQTSAVVDSLGFMFGSQDEPDSSALFKEVNKMYGKDFNKTVQVARAFANSVSLKMSADNSVAHSQAMNLDKMVINGNMNQYEALNSVVGGQYDPTDKMHVRTANAFSEMLLKRGDNEGNRRFMVASTIVPMSKELSLGNTEAEGIIQNFAKTLNPQLLTQLRSVDKTNPDKYNDVSDMLVSVSSSRLTPILNAYAKKEALSREIANTGIMAKTVSLINESGGVSNANAEAVITRLSVDFPHAKPNELSDIYTRVSSSLSKVPKEREAKSFIGNIESVENKVKNMIQLRRSTYESDLVLANSKLPPNERDEAYNSLLLKEASIRSAIMSQYGDMNDRMSQTYVKNAKGEMVPASFEVPTDNAMYDTVKQYMYTLNGVDAETLGQLNSIILGSDKDTDVNGLYMLVKNNVETMLSSYTTVDATGAIIPQKGYRDIIEPTLSAINAIGLLDTSKGSSLIEQDVSTEDKIRFIKHVGLNRPILMRDASIINDSNAERAKRRAEKQKEAETPKKQKDGLFSGLMSLTLPLFELQ